MIEEDEELVQLILKGHSQYVIDVYSSKAYGWIKKCISVSPDQIEEVVDSLNLDEGESAEIICHTLSAALEDIEEHAEYSEFIDEQEDIEACYEKWNKKKVTTHEYEWSYLYQLGYVVKTGIVTFMMAAKPCINNQQQLDIMQAVDSAKKEELANSVLQIKDFSFLCELADEAIVSVLANSLHHSAATNEQIERAEKLFEAFDYYISKRPFPKCFGTLAIVSGVWLTARSGNKQFAEKVSKHLDKVAGNVAFYTHLSAMYATLNERELVIKNLKLASEFGARSYDFHWSHFSPWDSDTEVQKALPVRVEERV